MAALAARVCFAVVHFSWFVLGGGQVLEALLLALLKDTASPLYRQPISMFIREILVGLHAIS